MKKHNKHCPICCKNKILCRDCDEFLMRVDKNNEKNNGKFAHLTNITHISLKKGEFSGEESESGMPWNGDYIF